MTCNDCRQHIGEQWFGDEVERRIWVELCPRHVALEERLKELERQLYHQQVIVDPAQNLVDAIHEKKMERLSTQVRDLEQRVTVLDAGWATCSLVYKESQKEVDRLTAEVRDLERQLEEAAELRKDSESVAGLQAIRIRVLKAEVERLTVELREAAEYGDHKRDCPAYELLPKIQLETPRECTCGYQQWLTRYGRKG